MSFEPGGRSDKFGNEFERHWMVGVALRVLDGQYTFLQWEPLIALDAGIEGRAGLANGGELAFQCKQNNGLKGKWSLKQLQANGVLAAAKNWLGDDPSRQFAFVSQDSV